MISPTIVHHLHRTMLAHKIIYPYLYLIPISKTLLITTFTTITICFGNPVLLCLIPLVTSISTSTSPFLHISVQSLIYKSTIHQSSLDHTCRIFMLQTKPIFQHCQTPFKYLSIPSPFPSHAFPEYNT